MSRSRTLTLILISIVAAGGAFPVVSQDEGLNIVVEGTGISRIPIAVPDPHEGAWLSSGRELMKTLREDLSFSGYFDLLGPEVMGLVDPGEAGSGPPLKQWLEVGADALLMTTMNEEPGRLRFDVRLYDTTAGDDGEMLLGRRYGGQDDLARRVAHRAADDIVRQLTGQTGVAQTRMAYVARTSPRTKEIYLMDYDGARPRRLTNTGSLCLSPAWSPDGERLAYISFRGRQPGVDIVDKNGNIRRVEMAGGDLNSAPDWSPDGRRLAFSSTRDRNSEIYLIDLGSGRETRLTVNQAIDSSPSWSPNGREIAFTSSRAGSPQIYIMDAEGLNPRRLSHAGTYNDSAAWSPRGDRIAFVSRLEGRFQIIVHDLARGADAQITFEGNNENPRWSPDGRHLVFASDRRGTYQIYTAGADGSNPRKLTSGEPAFTPDWSR